MSKCCASAQKVGLLIAVTACLISTDAAFGGMRPPVMLTDLAKFRLQSVSFFLVILLICAAFVRWGWNYLGRDFKRLPHLTYPKSIVLVLLWGLTFMIVLSMIAGARELMTPGAWESRADGGYRLAQGTDDNPYARTGPEYERRQRIEQLRDALWIYAQANGRRLPPDEYDQSIPQTAWICHAVTGIRFIYIPGRRADEGDQIVAYEPGTFGSLRWVLRASGAIEQLTIDGIREELLDQATERL